MSPGQPQQPFDLKESKLTTYDDFAHLARYICEEVQNAIDVRGPIDLQLDYWHRIYEQDRTRLWTNRPKPNGADLTSFIGTQYVDALHARIMKTIFTDRPWVVEGWGDSSANAPFVEEFHTWTFEDERGQSVMDQVLQNALIDGVGVLEVTEGCEYRPVRKTIWAKLDLQPDPVTGEPRPAMDENHRPKLAMANGKFIEAKPPADGLPSEGAAQIQIDSLEAERVGPQYEIIDFADFYTLPSHARCRQDVWGYAKRFFRRVPYLQKKADDGIYDVVAITAIGDDNEREQTLDDQRRDVTIGRLEGRTAEKELFEVPMLIDLDGTGERWWLATVHVPTQRLLRLKHDELGTQAGCGRFVRFVPYPRKNSVDGLSMIGHKLITIIEEHTATRNGIADRAALANSAPIKVLQGAVYDPEEQPVGPGSIIWCRDMNEVMPMEIPDVSEGMYRWSAEAAQSAERTIGITDVAAGIEPDERRTATERRLTAGYSEIRTDLVTKRCQEPMEDLFQIRHVIWQRLLAEQQDGLPIPQRAMSGLEARAVEIPTVMKSGKFTAELLQGKFRGKPRGSTETADPAMRRNNLNGMLVALAGIMKVNPQVQSLINTPRAARALLQQVLVDYNIEDRQAFLGTSASAVTPGPSRGQPPPGIQALLQGGAPPQGALPPGSSMAAAPPSPAPPAGGVMPPPEALGGGGLQELTLKLQSAERIAAMNNATKIRMAEIAAKDAGSQQAADAFVSRIEQMYEHAHDIDMANLGHAHDVLQTALTPPPAPAAPQASLHAR